MTKIILAAALALVALVGPSTISAEAKHGRGHCGGFGNYPGNSYFGHHHKRGNGRGCGGGGWGYTGYNNYGYNNYGYNNYNRRGTAIDRLVGNGGYRRGFF